MARKDIHEKELWLKMAQESGYKAAVMAQMMGVSRRQLQRWSQALFQRSPQEWLDEQRLTLALELMKQHKSVKMVAAMLGFRQRSHFSREFKEHYGFSAGKLANTDSP